LDSDKPGTGVCSHVSGARLGWLHNSPGKQDDLVVLIVQTGQASGRCTLGKRAPAGMARASRMARALAVLMVAAFGLSAVSGELRCCIPCDVPALQVAANLQCASLLFGVLHQLLHAKLSFSRLRDLCPASNCLL
jgi:hypothetical protein